MTDKRRNQIVHVARSYERILTERRGYFLEVIKCHQEGRKDEVPRWKEEWRKAGDRRGRAERLLARHIYGCHDFVRVDGVIYMAYSMSTLLRIPIEDIPDLAAETETLVPAWARPADGRPGP